MFATFNSSMDARGKSAASTAPPPSTRPKRNVASRACDRCRANRVKCDDGQPCRHCRVKGVECRKGRPGEPSDRDVDTLRSRVSELEAQLQQRSAQNSPGAPTANADPASLPSPPESDETTSPSRPMLNERGLTKSWLGFWKIDPSTKQGQYYGPTSFNFFVHRVGGYLVSGCNQPQLAEAMQSVTAVNPPFATADYGAAEPFPLTRRQEEGLLDMFWQSYHPIFPILDENVFRDRYMSLWGPSFPSPMEPTRQPSALVDIILALCIQFSAAALASSVPTIGVDIGHSRSQDGKWLYDRCQSLLRNEHDGPSIAALQCHIYSAIFLTNCYSCNQAHGVLSAAVHVACALGLNHELPEDLPPSHRSLLRRLWLTLLYLDSKLSLDLGRPFLIPWPRANTEQSYQEATTMTGTSNAVFEDINWLTYQTQYVKLMTVIRKISVAFSAKCDELLAVQPADSIYSNPSALEASATSLRQSVSAVQTWVSDIPAPLKLSRKEHGDAFSVARYQVQFDAFVPIWLQRQRLLLELLYHNALLCLYRTFIRYPSPSSSRDSLGPSITTVSLGNAVSALNHGVATIQIIDQALMETDLLNSWHRAFQYLWEASITVLGFTLARPLCPHTVSARKTISSAIRSFGVFAVHGISAAANAARVMRELSSTSGDTLGTLRTNFSMPMQPFSHSASLSGSQSNTPVLQQPYGLTNSLSNNVSSSWPTQTPTQNASLIFNDPTMMNFFQPDQMSSDGINSSFADSISLTSAPMTMDFSADVMNAFDMQNAVQGLDWDADLGTWPAHIGGST